MLHISSAFNSFKTMKTKININFGFLRQFKKKKTLVALNTKFKSFFFAYISPTT